MTVSRHPFSQYRSFSRLFATYTGEFGPLSSFFAGDYRDPRQRGQIAVQVADHYTARTELEAILTDQNNAFGAGDATRDNISRLAQQDAVAVVTGQQLGLFLGPLYTIYKTITAVQLAKRLERDTGRPAVPVFWLEGEDHDLDEVSSTAVYGGNGIERIAYAATGMNGTVPPVPVGRIAFDASISEVVSCLETLLPPTEFRDAILGRVRESYTPGATFMQAFTRLMGSIFGNQGLVFVSGDDRRLKHLAAPLFRKEIREYTKSESLLKRTSSKLADAYHVQVQSEPTNLFLMTGEGR